MCLSSSLCAATAALLEHGSKPIGLTATSENALLKAGSLQTCRLQVVTWAPQNDVLGHPRVKAFLSHCGANSMYEVDALAIPQTL